MKKILAFTLMIVLILSSAVACSPDEPEEPMDNGEGTEEPMDEEDEEPMDNGEDMMYEDGVYYASQEEFGETGWKSFVVLTVEDGKFTDAKWDSINRVPQENKYAQSMNGDYGMVEYGDAQAYWYEQADSTVEYFLENQSVDVPEDFYTSEEGNTDAIAGVSVHVVEFFDLAKEAVKKDPVPEGEYTDGFPVAIAEEAGENGWKSMVQLIIVNGTIVDANFNALSIEETDEDGNYVDKDLLMEDYGMVAAGSEYEWYEQAEMVEDFVVENQNLDIEVDDGYTDAIAGVSVHVDEMVELFNEAVK